ARVELDHASLDLVEPQLWPRQVTEQADLAAGELRGLARPGHGRGVLVAGAVREVEPENVGARPDQLRHPLDGARGGPDRGDDLGAPPRGRGGAGKGLAGTRRHRRQAPVGPLGPAWGSGPRGVGLWSASEGSTSAVCPSAGGDSSSWM